MSRYLIQNTTEFGDTILREEDNGVQTTVTLGHVLNRLNNLIEDKRRLVVDKREALSREQAAKTEEATKVTALSTLEQRRLAERVRLRELAVRDAAVIAYLDETE